MSSFLHSFVNALHGINLAGAGRNFRVQLIAAAWAFLICWVGDASRERWAAVILASVLVLGAECCNTALEKLCDRVTGEQEEAIRAVKDLAAGGVLLCAIGALGVAVAVFGELEFWKGILHKILYDGQAWAAFVILGLPAAALSAALPPKNKNGKTKTTITVEQIEDEHGDH